MGDDLRASRSEITRVDSPMTTRPPSSDIFRSLLIRPRSTSCNPIELSTKKSSTSASPIEYDEAEATTTTTTTSGTWNPSGILNDSTHARTRSGRVEARRIGIGVLLGRVCGLYLPVIEELHKEKASARTAGGSDEAAPEGEARFRERGRARRKEEGGLGRAGR